MYSCLILLLSCHFGDILEEGLEAEGCGEVELEEAIAAQITEPEDDECDSTIWKPWTYCSGDFLSWILFAAACAILLILCCCCCRCCYLCCTRTRRMNRAKSGYQVGQAMFAPIDSNAENESAFQSDLRNAIEMNKQKKLLKKVDSLDLDTNEVADAFDMDFDEIKPIKKEKSIDAEPAKPDVNRQGTTTEIVLKKEDENKKSESENNGNNDNNGNNGNQQQKPEAIKAKKNTRKDIKSMIRAQATSFTPKGKKGSEGMAFPMTGDTDYGFTTPGGPTPGGPDDEDNPPPAPAPPSAPAANFDNVDEYDLL